jgi:hypothetical protein
LFVENASPAIINTMRFKRVVVDSLETAPLPWASMPYQDARTFDPSADPLTRPKGIRFDNCPPPQYMDEVGMAEFWELIRTATMEGSAFHADDEGKEYYMQLAIVNSLFRDSSLVKVPRFIQAALRTKKTTLTLEQCLRVAQNPDFTPVWEGQKKGRFGDKEKRTRVYVANNWLPLLPVVYYVNLAGFVVACHRRWVSTEKATEYLNKGTGEVIGHRSWKSGGTRVDSWMVRSYKLLLSAPDPDNYRFVNLSDEDCNGTRYKCSVAGLVAVSHFGARPSVNHVVHHKGRRWDNRVDLLEWVTQRENMLLMNRTPGKCRFVLKHVNCNAQE